MLSNDITPRLLIDILCKNFGIKRLDGCDYVAEMDAKQAFNFVQIVNGFSGRSYFLTSDFEPIAPVIYAIPSMETYTILDHYTKRPSLFNGPKYLRALMKNKSDEEDEKRWKTRLQETTEEIGVAPEQCVITEIYGPYKGGSLEAFTEYVAGRLLAMKGFFTENQISLQDLGLEGSGIPDLFAFRLPVLAKALRSAGLPAFGFLHELALLKVFGKPPTTEVNEVSSLNESEERCFIVGESKTGPTSQQPFLEKHSKYNGRGMFHRFVQITPCYPKINEEWDYIDFEDNGSVSYKPGAPQAENECLSNWSSWREYYTHTVEETRSNMERHIINRSKFYLLQNLELRQQFELLGTHSRTWAEFHQALVDTDINQLIGWVQSEIG